MVYMGVDSMNRLSDLVETEFKGYAIHFDYRFHSVQINRMSKYWKPSYMYHNKWTKHGYLFYHEEAVATECNVDTVGPRKGNVIAALLHDKKNVFVCGKTISHLPKMGQVSHVSKFIPRDSPECRKKYPFLCIEEGRPELIDAFTLEDENGKEFVVAYYGESQISLPTLYERDYDIVTWRDGKVNNSQKAVGQLSAIDFYELNNETKVVKGLFATNDGRICRFEHKIGETNFDFEHHGSIMEGCRALQTYLGCPQAWCLDALIDASFTLTNIDDKEQVFFVRYRNMWVLDAGPLPMDVPSVQNAILLSYYGGLPHYYQVKQTFVFVLTEPFAAFTYPVKNGSEFVMIARLAHWYYFNDSVKDLNVAKEHRLFHSKYSEKDGYIGNIEFPDAAWFDKAKRTLYLFKGDKYYTFENEVDIRVKDEWKKTGEGNTSDLGLTDADGNAEDGIDAVVSMNGTNYFFTQRERFYEIEDGDTQAKGPSKLIQKDFFRVQSQCYYNENEPYLDLLRRHNETLPPKMNFKTKPGEYQILSSEQSQSSIAPYIIGIITIGVFIAIVGLTLLYVFGNGQGDIIRTRVVTRYEEKQPPSKSGSKQLKSKSALKPLKSKSTSNSLKSKSVVKRVTLKSTK